MHRAVHASAGVTVSRWPVQPCGWGGSQTVAERNPRRQELTMEFLGAPWGELPMQKRPDFGRTNVEELREAVDGVPVYGA